MANQDLISGSLMHKAFAQKILGNNSDAITTFNTLFDYNSSKKEAMLQAGMLAESTNKLDLAVDYYSKVSNKRISSKTDDPGELARRAVERLKLPNLKYAKSAIELADMLFTLIEKREIETLKSLISKTHFSIGTIGGHTVYEDLSLLDTLFDEFTLSNVKVKKQYLEQEVRDIYQPLTGKANCLEVK